MNDQSKEELQLMRSHHPSELQINMIGFDLQDVTSKGCSISMEQDVCMTECFPEDAPVFTRHIAMRVTMPLPDNSTESYNGFWMFCQYYEDFYTFGFFYTLPQAIKYFKENFAKIARAIRADEVCETPVITIKGFNFEKVELPNIYTEPAVTLANLFEED